MWSTVLASVPTHVEWRALFGSVQTGGFALAADAALVAAGAAYLAGARRARAGGAGWWGWRAASFLGGLVVVFLAVGSGLATYVDHDASANVVQHVLLMMVGPPLLVLGRPVSAWRSLAGQWRAAAASIPIGSGGPIGPIGPSARIARAVRSLSGAVSWPLYYGSMGAYFLTALYADAVHDEVVLHVVQVGFVAVGCLFWSGLVGLDRRGARRSHAFRLVAVIAGMPVETAVGLALVLWPHPLAGTGTLAATHAAGLALWLASMVSSGVALAVLLVQWGIADTTDVADLEAALEAARPVAPGTGSPLGRAPGGAAFSGAPGDGR